MLRSAKTRNIVNRLASKHGYTMSALIRALKTNEIRFKHKLSRPSLFTVAELIKLSGLFGIKVEVLIYMLLRGMEASGKTDKQKKEGYWYISEEIKREGEQVYNSIGDEDNK